MNTLLIILACFQADATQANRPLKDVQIVWQILPLKGYAAITTATDNGYLIQVDEAFMDTFEGKTQLKRLVYMQLGYALLDCPHGMGLMDDKKIFKRRITKNELHDLFNGPLP